jgi:hypothetical protein
VTLSGFCYVSKLEFATVLVKVCNIKFCMDLSSGVDAGIKSEIDGQVRPPCNMFSLGMGLIYEPVNSENIYSVACQEDR